MRRHLIWTVLLIAALLSGHGPAQAGQNLTCAPFAREISGIQLSGRAATWWASAEGSYERGNLPAPGAVIVFAKTKQMPFGHVGVVRELVDARTILIDHANWGGREGRAEYRVPVRDVSKANDWSEVRVWYAPIQRLGIRRNPVSGFIYPEKIEQLASN